MMPVPIVCATLRPKNRNAMKLKKAAQKTAILGPKYPRRNDRGDGIGRIVQSVEEVERQSHER